MNKGKTTITEGNVKRPDLLKDDRLSKFIQKIKDDEPFKVDTTDNNLPVTVQDTFVIDRIYIDNKTYNKKNIDELSDELQHYNGKTIYLFDKDNQTIRLTQLVKTDEFGGISLNRGYVGELVFGVAMYKLFTSDVHTRVTVDLIQTGIKELSQSKGLNVDNGTSPTKDSEDVPVEFKYKFNQNLVKDSVVLINKGVFEKEYKDLLSATIEYVNHNTGLLEWRNELYYQGDSSIKIDIEADGISNNVESKTDVEMSMYDTYDSRSNVYQLLQNFKVSIKTGNVKQFGQVGGNRLDSMQKLFKGICVLDDSLLDVKEDIVTVCFDKVQQSVQHRVGDSTLSNDLYKYVKKHLTGGDNVDVIRLQKTYSTYDLDKMKDYIKQHISKLKVVNDNNKLLFNIDGQLLFSIRHRKDGKYQRNVLESGKLFDEFIKSK